MTFILFYFLSGVFIGNRVYVGIGGSGTGAWIFSFFIAFIAGLLWPIMLIYFSICEYRYRKMYKKGTFPPKPL